MIKKNESFFLVIIADTTCNTEQTETALTSSQSSRMLCRLDHDHIDEYGDAESESNDAAAAKPESNIYHLPSLTGTKPYQVQIMNYHLNGSYLVSGA